MRWLALTVGLLCASVALVGWVYLRDRDTASWRPSERQLARVDAEDVLSAVGGGACRTGCASQELGRVRPRRWLVRVTAGGRTLCLEIDLDAFAMSPRGVAGARLARCPRGDHRSRRAQPRATSR
ncbi:MAG TPA: hypothetical protein VK756_05940 [Solirubrobacteraceae bacterium]|nr:hypothetical protein [Solirubrobacteraceae bacterium]